MNIKLKNIAIVTGSRADYGLLREICKILEHKEDVQFSLIVSGSHFSSKHGNTFSEINIDKFENIIKVDLDIHGSSGHDINIYIGRAIERFSKYFSSTDIDVLIILGDRYEVFGAAVAAATLNIKIAHIHGGEVTEGAFDDFLRQSITKMSYLHFTAHKEYSSRVVQLGENPDQVFCFGGLGASVISNSKSELLTKEQCTEVLGLTFNKKNLLVVFHPETKNKENNVQDLIQLLRALDTLQDTHLIFTMPNADTNFVDFFDIINKFVSRRPLTSFSYPSVGQKNFLSLLKAVDGIIGNSSSGILEAPSFCVGTVNIGQRQAGRVRSSSIIDVNSNYDEIIAAIKRLHSKEFKEVLKVTKNPFLRNNTSEKIVDIVLMNAKRKNIKKFYNLVKE